MGKETKISLEYCGMQGWGETVSKAKADAAMKIKRALEDMAILTYTARGHCVVAARYGEACGYKIVWDSKMDERICDSGLSSVGFETVAEALRAGRKQLAAAMDDASIAAEKDRKEVEADIERSRVYTAQIRLFESILEREGKDKNLAHGLCFWLPDSREIPTQEQAERIVKERAN